MSQRCKWHWGPRADTRCNSGWRSTDRMFGKFNEELEALRSWRLERGRTHVVMESTGPYWKPIFQHSGRQPCGGAGQQVKARRGHKTDWQDCAGLTDFCLSCGPQINFTIQNQ